MTAPSGERSSRRPLGRQRDEGCRKRRTPIRQVEGSRPAPLALTIRAGVHPGCGPARLVSADLRAGGLPRRDHLDRARRRLLRQADGPRASWRARPRHGQPVRRKDGTGKRSSRSRSCPLLGRRSGRRARLHDARRQVQGLGREVIVLEGRGTGHSEPSLVCPDFDALPAPPVASPVDDPQTRTGVPRRDRTVPRPTHLSRGRPHRVRPPGDGGRRRGSADRAWGSTSGT